eukprot:jgi/Tetstr1/461045/TSEL_006195.t1
MAACYYGLLGVEKTATAAEIKAAFRARAKECHPDINPAGGTVGEARFKALTEAHETLQDPFKRAQYDSLASLEQRAAGGATRAAGMTMDEYLKYHVKYWQEAAANQEWSGTESDARQREAQERWRQQQAASWEWEKRDAKLRKEQYSAQFDKATAAKQKRTTRILGRFWQTHRGPVWQDAVFAAGFCAATAATAYCWKCYLRAREERLAKMEPPREGMGG